MLKALEGIAAEWFTPSSQEKEEEPTRFMIKPLNSEQLDHVMEGRRLDADGNLSLSASGIKQALNYGLKDWENFENSAGPVKCRSTNFNLIPWVERQELAGEIINKSLMPEEAEKNS